MSTISIWRPPVPTAGKITVPTAIAPTSATFLGQWIGGGTPGTSGTQTNCTITVTNGALALNQVVDIDTGAAQERVQITALTGTGPYTVNFTTTKAHTLSVGVVGLIYADIQPASKEQVADIAAMVLYRSFMIYVPGYPVPDVRIQDVLIDSSEIDPLTGLPATYIVRGRQSWPGDHHELLCERQEGA